VGGTILKGRTEGGAAVREQAQEVRQTTDKQMRYKFKFSYESGLRPGEKHDDGELLVVDGTLLFTMWGGENKYVVNWMTLQNGFVSISVVESSVDCYIKASVFDEKIYFRKDYTAEAEEGLLNLLILSAANRFGEFHGLGRGVLKGKLITEESVKTIAKLIRQNMEGL
jgi:hypothetical protein